MSEMSAAKSSTVRVAPTRVTVVSGESGYAQVADVRHHEIRADEPAAAGGTDKGPRPTELVLAGLGACTSITLRMYAERKGWNIGTVRTVLTLYHDEPPRIERRVSFSATLLPEQRSRLAEISEKTPVTRMLKSGIAIDTSVE